MNDKIYTSEPINKQAKMAVQKVNQPSHGFIASTKFRSRDKPPTKAFTGLHKDDLTGGKKGYLTVIGVFIKIAGAGNSNNAVRWVVKCGCGYYETRTTKALKNPKNIDECCVDCKKIHHNDNLHPDLEHLNFVNQEKRQRRYEARTSPHQIIRT